MKFNIFNVRIILLLLVAMVAGSGSLWAQAITGVVADSEEPVIGAVVTEKGTTNSTVTDIDGAFSIVPKGSFPVTLIIKSIGYVEQEVTIAHDEVDQPLSILLEADNYTLQDVVVIGYGQSSRKKLTGAVTKLKAATVASSSSSSPLTAIQGNATGVYLEQSSGDPGATVNLIIRGQSTFGSSTPLYIVDGVPYTSTVSNPLQLINPKDIESMEILKDADATAIYGNRGSNGVVIITTKQGESGKIKVDLMLSGEVQWIGRRLDYLNTEEYLTMRREALEADIARGDISREEVTAINFPDLYKWDQTAYTDFQELFLGGKPFGANAQINLSGGSENLKFMVNAGYYTTGSCAIGNNKYKRFTAKTGINYISPNKRITFDASMLFTRLMNNKAGGSWPASFITMAPNMPLYDENGHPYYESQNDRSYAPMSALEYQNETKTTSIVTSMTASYKIWRELTAKVSLGMTNSSSNQEAIQGTYYYNPVYNYGNYAYYKNDHNEALIVEPQLTYRTDLFGGSFNALLGATYQRNEYKSTYMAGQGYPDDRLLHSASAASSIYYKYTSKNQSKQASLFTRLGYDYQNRYIANVVLRRDGSSKFAPGKRWGTFWSVGVAWMFSNEQFVKNFAGDWLSHGKLRFSLGHTGGDGIGNFLYLNRYTTYRTKYLNDMAIYPSRVANGNLHWESNDKKDIGLELGFLEDRILLNTTFFHTKSYDMLTSVKAAGQTGFTSVTANLDAVVFNYGLELELNTVNFRTPNFAWTTSFNLTFPKNKLHSFPGLEYSAYKRTYAIGESLNCIYAYKYLGVDPETGVGIIQDVNGDGKIDYTNDRTVVGDRDPDFYGGLTNVLTYKNFTLDFTFYFRRKPKSIGILWVDYLPTGYQSNVIREVYENSWRTPGQEAKYPGLSTTTSSEVGKSFYSYLSYSDYAYSDASFIRLQNIKLGYKLPEKILNPLHISRAEVYVQARNLFTLTKFDSYDPEANGWRLPTTSSFIFGIDLSF